MADCTGRRPSKKKNKQTEQNQSSSGSSPEFENGDFGDKEVLRYLVAAQSDDIKTLEQYLQRGMPVDTKCLMFLDTALHKACRTGSIKALEYLLAHGADICTKTDDGQSALHIAVKKPEVISVLLAHGANPDVKADGSGVTPLMLAASMTNTEAVQILIEAGSSLDCQNKAGMCALHHCFSYYQDRPEFIAHSVDCAQLLVEAGADICIKDNNGKYPLTRALEKMNMRGVKYFLAHNAELDNYCIKYHNGPTLSAIAFAVATKRSVLGDLLWYAGATCKGVWSVCHHLQTLPEALTLADFAFSQPRSLKEACRKVIRDHLRCCGATGVKFRSCVNTLQIPMPLKDFILLKDLLNL